MLHQQEHCYAISRWNYSQIVCQKVSWCIPSGWYSIWRHEFANDASHLVRYGKQSIHGHEIELEKIANANFWFPIQKLFAWQQNDCSLQWFESHLHLVSPCWRFGQRIGWKHIIEGIVLFPFYRVQNFPNWSHWQQDTTVLFIGHHSQFEILRG